MTYYSAKELAASFRTVRNNTITIAEEIDEKNYGYRATPETRSVAETLVHIVNSTRIQSHIQGDLKLADLSGFDFFGFVGPLIADEKTPRSKAQIIALLKENLDSFGSWLESLTDPFLGEIVTYPPGMTPPTKSRFEMIMSAKEHEMHHRGQLMLMQRMLGLKPHLTRHMEAIIAQMAAGKQ